MKGSVIRLLVLPLSRGPGGSSAPLECHCAAIFPDRSAPPPYEARLPDPIPADQERGGMGHELAAAAVPIW